MLASTLTFKLVERSLGKALKALPPRSLFSRLREWFEFERCLGMRFSLDFLDALSLKLSNCQRTCERHVWIIPKDSLYLSCIHSYQAP